MTPTNSIQLPPELALRLFHLLVKMARSVSWRVDSEAVAGDVMYKILRQSTTCQRIIAYRVKVEAGYLPLWLLERVKSKAWQYHKKQQRQCALTDQTLEKEQNERV